jgi:Polyketide cyclase / dehydrase and lipid transport
MADLEFCVDVAAQPNLVFAFFVPQRMPYWYAAEMESQFEVQGGASEFQLGQKVRITGKLRGREMSMTVVVTRYDWPRVLEWQFLDCYGVRGLQRWLVEPAPLASSTRPEASEASQGPATRVRMRDTYEMPGGLGKIVDWLLTRRSVSHRDRDALARLKRLAERNPTE